MEKELDEDRLGLTPTQERLAPILQIFAEGISDKNTVDQNVKTSFYNFTREMPDDFKAAFMSVVESCRPEVARQIMEELTIVGDFIAPELSCQVPQEQDQEHK